MKKVVEPARFERCAQCLRPIIPGVRFKLIDGKAEHINCDTWDKPDEGFNTKPGPILILSGP